MVSSYQTTKRAASFFVALFLVINLMMGVICPVYAAEEDSIPLDEYSFVETICGAFNCFYFPEKLASSELSSWSDVKNYEGSFKMLLVMMSGYYNTYANTLYQTTDPDADNYISVPYLYYDLSGSTIPENSMYNVFLTEGCLDFSGDGAMGPSEFKVLQITFNNVFKLMYDYNYHLVDYPIAELSKSVPHISGFHNVGMNYSWRIGYNMPTYYYDSINDWDLSALLTTNENVLNTWMNDFSSDGFKTDNYICFINRGSETSKKTSDLLNFNIVSTYLSEVDYSSVIVGVKPVNSTTQSITITSSCSVHTFVGSGTNSSGFSTSCNSTTQFSDESYSCNGNYTSNMPIISPLIGYYEFNGNLVHNWGQDLIIGSSVAWDSYCTFEGDSDDVYNVPSETTLNTIILSMVSGDDSSIHVDRFTGIFTGSNAIDSEEDPDFDYDRIEDTIKDSVNGVLNGGDYSDGNNAQNNLDNVLGEYEDAENQLKDFTNLDSAIETYWNTNDLLENATTISTVSTYFMIFWDSFGPFGILFSLAIALGLAAFLLKI